MATIRMLQAINIACPDCDLLNRVPELAPGESANCSRCDCTLSRFPPNCIDRVLALNFAAIVLYIIACYFPFLSFGKAGIMVDTHLVSGITGRGCVGAREFRQHGLRHLGSRGVSKRGAVTSPPKGFSSRPFANEASTRSSPQF